MISSSMYSTVNGCGYKRGGGFKNGGGLKDGGGLRNLGRLRCGGGLRISLQPVFTESCNEQP
jgi:hypothetical protein